MNKMQKTIITILAITPFIFTSQANANDLVTAQKVSVMGVKLCSDIVNAGQYLESIGYKNAALYAKNLKRIQNVTKTVNSDNHTFNINFDGYKKKDNINIMAFHGSFKNGENLFEKEKAQFEQSTGKKLTCNHINKQETYIECKYPANTPTRETPGFSYTITQEGNSQSFFIDAAAWGYSSCN